MRKIIQTAAGEPEVLVIKEVPAPQPAAGEVAVRVRAAGVNPVDVAVRAGYYPLLGEPPFTVGWDIAGEVIAVGSGVSKFKAGDQVFGMPNFPKEAAAYAEIVVAPADELAQRPDALGIEAAGAIPLAGLTAWLGLVKTAEINSGDRVLVLGAAGGVGHLAVQIAKAKGAYVVASASAGKLAYLKSIGADEVTDATTDFASRPDRFDIVFDPFAGENAEKSLNVLKPGGTLICLLDPSDAAKSKASREGKQLHRISVHPDAEALASLAGLVEQGKLKVHVAKAFDLAEAPAAHAFLATKPIGKIVLLS